MSGGTVTSIRFLVSVKHWAKVGWEAHVDDLEQERLQDIAHTKHLVEEYHKAGCPPG